MKTRLLLLVQGLGVGGAERQIVHLLRHLDRNRFEPHVGILFPGEHRLRAEVEALGIPVSQLAFRWPLAHPTNWVACARLQRWLRLNAFDLVHAHLYHANILAAWLGERAILSELNMGYANKSFHLRIARVSYRRARAIIVNARAIADLLITNRIAPREKIIVIHNGIPIPSHPPNPDTVNAARQRMGVQPNDWVVTVVGRFHPIKGHIYLINAVPSVPDAVFVFAGEGAERSTLEARARELGIAHRLRFVGHVADVPSLLAGTNAFALPSLSEGLSNALMEAMAMACPIVATNVGGNSELVEHGRTGLLVPPANTAALAAALNELRQNPTRAAQLGLAARQFILDYSVENMARRFMELYEQVRTT